jgi:hypothetical protein
MQGGATSPLRPTLGSKASLEQSRSYLTRLFAGATAAYGGGTGGGMRAGWGALTLEDVLMRLRVNPTSVRAN